MAETLTFENTPEVTSVDNLNADEQDSLQVGEAMQEAQDNLLAGKYKDAQELESAYIELQKKLGDTEQTSEAQTSEEKPQAETESKDTESKDKEPPAESSVLDTLWNEVSSGDKVSQETLSKLKEANPADLAQDYLNYRANNAPRDLSQQDVAELKGIVGGEENYSNMLDWAQSNLNEQEVNMFDAVMERGDPLAAFFAVRSLAYRYNDAVGYDGNMVTGNASKSNSDTFRSQAEVVKAMSDSRYDNDPAYRQDVMQKLERSNVNF